MCRTKENYK
uniref:Uncharacterized protein n=1 Tax=Rhizophora mucronata TaxID=61149 RepID=A0A2P2N8Q6_RHIMU